MQGSVQDIAFGGHGVVKVEGKVCFVPFVCEDETVEIEVLKEKKHFSFGEVKRILKSSPDRIEPKCPYYGTCGGCQFQHIRYPQQLEIKSSFVKEALNRIGGMAIDFVPIVGAEPRWNYRRRITLHLKNGKAGYLGWKEHAYVPIEACPIFSGTLPKQVSFEGKLTLIVQPKGLFGVLECEKIPSNPTLPPGFVSFTYHASKKVVILGEKWGEIEVLGRPFYFHPLSFLQAHPQVSEQIYSYILDAVASFSPKKGLDLYCGIGVLSGLFYDRGIEVKGVEISPFSILSAKKNCPDLSFIEGKVESHLKKLLHERPDFAVVNPPRQGIEKGILDTLIQKNIPRLIYISCMPSTLARDLKILLPHFRLISVQAFDMFPQTTHVETVVVLERI